MQILTFVLNSQPYAIDITLVDTIEDKMPITPVPKSKRYVAGLISNRGSVIPVIDTDMFMNGSDRKSIFEKFIIINMGDEKLALAVDDIDDVLDVNPEDIQPLDFDDSVSIVNVNATIITLLTDKQLTKI